MIRNLKLFWKFTLLALMIPVAIIIIAGIILNKTNTLKYEYDNLYGFMLIPLLDVDKGNLHREKLSANLLELTRPDLSSDKRNTLAELIRTENKMMTDFIARYESEWLTTLSPEFTAVLAKLGKQHLQKIEADTLKNFHTVYDVYVPKRDALLSGEPVNSKALKNDLAQMESTFDSLVKVNRQFADYSNESAQVAITDMRWLLLVSSLVLTIIALGIAWWFSYTIIHPLIYFTRAAQQLALGNLDSKKITNINIYNIKKITNRKDEIGDIGRAFETLTSYFQQIIKDITHISQGLVAGQLNVTSQVQYQGDFISIKIALETALSDLRLVIEDIVKVSQGLANGKLNVIPTAEYKGDFIQVKKSLETVLSNQRQVIDNIIIISQGLMIGKLDITSQAQYQGDFVQIGNALEKVLSNLRCLIKDIVQMSQKLVKGEKDIIPQAKYFGDFIQIKDALTIAATTLAEATTQNATQDWLKTGQAQLSEQMSGEQDIMTLAKNIVACLATRLDAQVGIFYSVEEMNRHNQTYHLKMLANYTQNQHKNIAIAFRFSEGIVGQAALEKRYLAFTIGSGLDETIPPHLLAIPFMYEDVVKGVIELGFLKPLLETQQAFLTQAMQSIGIAINTAESRTQMQTLLEQSKKQAEVLENQQEELQYSNEELQSQSEELQTQSEELQIQQEELRQINEELEERTQELERQQTKIQQKNLDLEQNKTEMEKAKIAIEIKAKELELSSKYKSEFLANMSHELRTPLNSMLILAQLLANNKQNSLDKKQVEYAQTIHSAGSDLLMLINEILDLSKVEAGKIDIHLGDLQLTEWLNTLKQKFQHVAESKGLTFNIVVAEDLPQILHTDIQRFQQIINNLLSNALKFTQNGEVKLTVQQHSLSSKDASTLHTELTETIAISVTDTGIGIPKDKQKVVFEAFQQADGSTSRRFGGTGLGLSISRQLAQLLGGELKLESEEGKGSTFTLYLPKIFAKKSTPDDSIEVEILGDSLTPNKASTSCDSTEIEPFGNLVPDKKSTSSEPTGIEQLGDNPIPDKVLIPTDSEIKPLDSSPIADDRNTLSSSDKSLLIIEDDRKFSHILLELAREKYFKCLIAEDGKTGLQLAQEYQPNAIILDIGLPQLDGWTVMERLKDNPNTRHIPVHFISASDEQSMDAKKMGAIGYLLKPSNIGELGEAFKKIERFIAKIPKNLLIIVDDEQRQQKIQALVEEENIQLKVVTTQIDASHHLQTTLFECIILDVDIEQKTGLQFLKQLQQADKLAQIPVIIYAERELTEQEEHILQECEVNITVKAVKSPERLLDETTLFLHQIESHLSKDKQKMLQMVHDKEAILKNKKVLVVDDDVRNTFALMTVLEGKNMEAIAGYTGKEALEMLDEQPDIALVLMDIMMPEMDGYEAMQKIRQQPRFRKLPIIALTAKAMKGDKAKCIEAGANDYLAKPVDTDKLISLMRVWLYQ
ncbi:response regulator [Candidatus Parabeggiatoa sp. HSG14]|uniref:response regulator n=1 Tax=Candidatus Parabeggiatoa sp. HSG14 TaxID=3055593 RepID=UPI0025A90102|nr:response regulator [Thiotrichales bacterium HSG14]